MLDLSHDYLSGSLPQDRQLVFLHGILGRGSNLRTLARRFVQEHPRWGATLVDLRGHGLSPKGSPAPTLVSCAADVRLLCENAMVPVTAVVGHSFGGKVALELLRQLPTLEHVFTLDSNPGVSAPMTDSDSPSSVLGLLRTLPAEFPNRTAFQDSLTTRGLSLPMAQWLAMSVVPTTSGSVRFALNLDEISALMHDYQTTDLWPAVTTRGNAKIHLVVGERSKTYSDSDRERAQRLAEAQPHVTVDFLPTGHMVHNEDLVGVLKVLSTLIGEPPDIGEPTP
jgi:esterase